MVNTRSMKKKLAGESKCTAEKVNENNSNFYLYLITLILTSSVYVMSTSDLQTDELESLFLIFKHPSVNLNFMNSSVYL